MVRLLPLVLLGVIAAAPAFAQKNVQAKTWSLATSFDGNRYSAWPAGDKPSGYQSAPTLLATDIVAGSTTGGESNKGAYVSLFGYSFGRQQDLGTAAGARVYFRTGGTWREVDNYRALMKSRVYQTHQVVQLIVQLGSLGSAANGSVMDIKVTVNGVDSNVLASAFTVQPGRFFFVDNGTSCHESHCGNDATGKPDDITKPFRYVQNFVGPSQTNFSGIWGTTTAQGDTGLRPGDTLVIRGGEWSDANGFEARWARFSQQSGTQPNGVSGNGYIHFTRYPGPINGNAPEDVHYVSPDTGYGGIHGVGTANSDLGYGRWWSVSGLRIGCSALTKDGPINMQSSSQTTAHDIRLYDNELGPWPSTLASPSNAKSAGITGNSNGGSALFNYVHDIDGDHSALENHGMYLDGSQHSTRSFRLAYNWIRNIPGGTGIQVHNQVASDSFVGLKIDHNYIENTTKYGINVGNSLQSADVFDNIVHDGIIGIRWDTPDANPALNIENNTVWQQRAQYGALANTGGSITSGSIKIRHNVIVLGAGHQGGLPYIALNGDTTTTAAQNLYYDEGGTNTTVPAIDATGIYGNPLFTDPANGNFTLQSGSPARASNISGGTSASAIQVDTDFYGIARPGGTLNASGTNDLGATQGAGT